MKEKKTEPLKSAGKPSPNVPEKKPSTPAKPLETKGKPAPPKPKH